jgi:hypothetical protein
MTRAPEKCVASSYSTNLVEIVDGPGIPATGHTIFPDGLEYHTLFNALFKSTVLTPVSLRLCDLTATFRNAGVNPPVLHCPFEEAFAAVDKKKKTSSFISFLDYPDTKALDPAQTFPSALSPKHTLDSL